MLNLWRKKSEKEKMQEKLKALRKENEKLFYKAYFSYSKKV